MKFKVNCFNFSLTSVESASFNTGLGVCMEGSLKSPTKATCKFNWVFSGCPLCQCNGHSTCTTVKSLKITTTTTTTIKATTSKPDMALNKNSIDSMINKDDNFKIIQEEEEEQGNSLRNDQCRACLNNTMGRFCENCAPGYYGDARNNGTCIACKCGEQADECDSTTGRCLCNTKGVVGIKCDQCETPRYTGRPDAPGGSCYYNLSTDFQFTFNLNKEADRYYKRISFVNHPVVGSDDDIDFMIRCMRQTALINVTFMAPYDFDNPDETVSRMNSAYRAMRGDENDPSGTNRNSLNWSNLFANLSNSILLSSNSNKSMSRYDYFQFDTDSGNDNSIFIIFCRNFKFN
jgi:hypothetical protein